MADSLQGVDIIPIILMAKLSGVANENHRSLLNLNFKQITNYSLGVLMQYLTLA